MWVHCNYSKLSQDTFSLFKAKTKKVDMRYPCPEWDFDAPKEQALKKHVESRHNFLVLNVNLLQQQLVIWRNMLKVNIKMWDILVFNVNLLQLQLVIWRNMLKVNINMWDILVFNVNLLQQQLVIWRNILKVNIKMWDILVLNVNLPQL